MVNGTDGGETVMVVTRLTEAERNELARLARADGRSVSALIRVVLRRYMREAK